MRHAVSNTLFQVFGHRACCPRIPTWTAYVGLPWRPMGESRWSVCNLFNAWWVSAAYVRRYMED